MIFVKKGKDQYLKIPSEYCMIDGVPETIKGNPMKMRKLLETTRKNPQTKMRDIGGMVKKLFNAGAENLSEWGIEIKAEPLSVNSRKLAVPMLEHKSGDDDLFCNEKLLK